MILIKTVFRNVIILAAVLSILISCSEKDNTGALVPIPEDLKEILKKEEIQVFQVYQGEKLRWSYIQEGWDANDIHIIHSCTKSIVSLLIGTLIDNGDIDSIDIPVYQLFPSLKEQNISEENKSLRLKHLLTMTTGLKSRDSYIYQWEGLKNIWNEKDWVDTIMNLPREVPAGQRFDYSNLSSYLLTEIIRAKTGKDVSLYAEEILFTPLKIESYSWDKNPLGQSTGWGGLYLNPSDLAKIGFLVMNKGEWDGKQIVSASWIEQSTSPKIDTDTLREFYGYQWWIDSDDRILALGYQGQYLIIDKKLDLVTVFASNLDDQKFFLPYKLYNSRVLPEFR